MSLQTGQIIEGKYRIVRLLGQGGMGSVYEGENTRIHRRVAIKVLHASVATKADIVQRFEREAQAAGRIGSEHIVEVLDLGSMPDGERFMVMEYLDGDSLGERIKTRGRLSALEAASILRQLLDGLGAAHEAGIVHRDLKPDNVFLLKAKGGQRDFVKLVDFGVSKFSALESDFSMTRTGAVMGTPFYMSPEQARGQKVDHRSDLYAVGVVAYQMITGRVPFNADTFNELLFKIALESPEPAELLAPGLDPNFSAIVMHGMAREAGARFQTAAEFRNAIDAWMMQHGGPPLDQSYGSNPGIRHSQGNYGAGAPAAGHPGASNYGHAPPLAQSGGSWPNQSASGMQAMQNQGAQPRPFGNTPNPAFATGRGHTPQRGVQQLPMGQAPIGQQLPMGPPLPMGQSQVALAVTTGQPKRNGALIAALVGMMVVGVGGGLAAFKLLGGKTSVATQGSSEDGRSVAAAPTKSETPKVEDSAMVEPPNRDVPKQDPPPAETASAATAPDAKPPVAAPLSGKLPTGKLPTATPKTPEPPKPPTTAQPSGRKIDGSL